MARHCVTLDVDGEPVRFQLTVPADQLTDADREDLIELARFVRAKHQPAQPAPTSSTDTTHP